MSAPKYLKNHKMWSETDYNYFLSKGYTNKEIKERWDIDFSNGNTPVIHAPIVDVVGYLSK